ncbi:hypothetical protein QBZ16_001175 [Prototheca wickerhamii]|uniref:Amino acid transporter transmembrane domain-containing protein n=1 Tax=Prototheca wickerhamii TaxID=3111 RepID=A0AAD9IEY7_PROWI|nr:hypothetical protein QBZ16_001175 [Prototheca wickerhamii]
MGTLLTAVGHTITAVIGAGVLNLPYAVSMLGWVAGPAAILLFSWITLFTSHLLAECHLYNGQRLRTYTDVVFVSFGKRGYHMLAWMQHSNLIMSSLAYQITGSIALQTLVQSLCGQSNCPNNLYIWSIVFAGVQLFLSQAPSLASLWWVSLMVGGQSLPPADKAFGVLNSTGSVLYAFAFTMILIEIQDTLKPDVQKNVINPMKKAVTVSAVATAGYMAFGNSVPQDILTGFPNPKWVNDWANLMLIIHMIPAYQVYLQPTIAFTEHHFSQWARAPAWLKGLPFRLLFRSSMVIAIGVVGILLPFFNDIVGLILNVASFVVSLAATVGSVYNIVVDASSYQIFGGA